MKDKEMTVARRSRTKLTSKGFNSTELTGVETGQKLQVSVRLEAETIHLIEEIQEKTGCSFAESLRRIVRKGLMDQNSKLSTHHEDEL
jgi:hypothetical protein